MMAEVKVVTLEAPDESREMPLMRLDLARIAGLTIGRGTVQPGFRWSTHIGVHTGEPLCRLHHLQLVLSGRFAVEMEGSAPIEVGPGDIFDVPPGHDAWVVGDEPVVLLDFLGNIGEHSLPKEAERVVSTVLMTDIVDSTATASRLGDSAWRQVLSDHNRLVRDRIRRHRGEEVNTTGDGFLVMFPSALSAVKCAAAAVRAVREVGIEIRVGVHTGEVELLGDDIGGVQVHALARIMGLAGPSDVLASGTTRALVEDSDLAFIDRGRHQVKGIGRPISVYELEGPSDRTEGDSGRSRVSNGRDGS